MRTVAMLALLLTGCAAVPIVPGGVPSSPEPTALLVRWEARGGECATGTTCGLTITLLRDGTWTRLGNGADRTGTLPAGRVAELVDAVENTGLATAPPFTDTCPVDYDGQEHVLTWLEDGSSVTVASCAREFGSADPLVAAASRLAEDLA